MKSFIQYITEARQTFVKGWTFKNKIVTSTNDFNNYHIMQVIKQPRKFGLTDKKIMAIFAKEYRDAPEDYPYELFDKIWQGTVDNDVYLEEYLMKKGYCMYVVDKKHGRVSGWDDKYVKMGVKAVDDKYLPFEQNGFKLFEVKPSKGKDQYITNKLDFNNYLSGRKKAKYVSPMAQFRESKQLIEGLKKSIRAAKAIAKKNTGKMVNAPATSQGREIIIKQGRGDELRIPDYELPLAKQRAKDLHRAGRYQGHAQVAKSRIRQVPGLSKDFKKYSDASIDNATQERIGRSGLEGNEKILYHQKLKLDAKSENPKTGKHDTSTLLGRMKQQRLNDYKPGGRRNTVPLKPHEEEIHDRGYRQGVNTGLVNFNKSRKKK